MFCAFRAKDPGRVTTEKFLIPFRLTKGEADRELSLEEQVLRSKAAWFAAAGVEAPVEFMGPKAEDYDE